MKSIVFKLVRGKNRGIEAQSRLLLSAIRGLILLLAVNFSGQVWGQTQAAPSQGTANAPSQAGDANSGGIDAGNLDKLLDIADKGDVSQLSQVSVAGQTGSASLDMPVSTVERQESTVGKTPAAVFVITNEMIRRSGVRNIPEVLRMAPGVEVAQISADKWAISIRGFNGRFANKLLVMIDGRSVYNQTFGGVYWDVQDTILEDVDHIEVVRGPGGTLWGENAVNGIISIITKSAKDTKGAYAIAGAGTEERDIVGARYGGQIGQDFSYRIYGKQFERGGGFSNPSYKNRINFDASSQERAGFRVDWDLNGRKDDILTIEGDCYDGDSGARDRFVLPNYNKTTLFGQEHVTGQDALVRWEHTYDERSDWALQMYFDRYTRNGLLLTEAASTFDIDFQHRFPLTERQEIIWGLGYRQIHDNLYGLDYFTLHYNPPELTTQLPNAFVQDEISLVQDRLVLYLGTKLGKNTFTGYEVQPSARVLWTPDDRRSAWAAISRAVRTPTRDDEGVVTTNTLSKTPAPPTFSRYNGSTDLLSENVIAYEIGYRVQATKKFSWDLAAFYNVYENLIDMKNNGAIFTETNPSPTHRIKPKIFENHSAAHSYGLELAMNYDVSERWHLYTGYTYYHQLIDRDSTNAQDGLNPPNQVFMRSAWNLTKNIDFDLMPRYVDNLPSIGIPSYITMDARLAWRPRRYKHLELAVVGQNLFQDHHPEFLVDNAIRSTDAKDATDVPRSVYGTISWRY